MNRIKKLKFGLQNIKLFFCLSALISAVIFFFSFNSKITKTSAEDSQDDIEKAIFTQQEFFGSSALVPLPTSEAREVLAKLSESQPDNPKILEKLAELNEKLENFDEAENNLIHLSEINSSKAELLIAFYHRRANFEKEAAVLKKLLFTAKAKNRTSIFERLIDLARIHDLKEYLQPKFYEEVTKGNFKAFGIFQKVSEKLAEEKNYSEALKFIRQAKSQFPKERDVLLEKEIDVLLAMDNAKEAETVYQAAFDPFWSTEEAQKFYDFLSDQDHLREYGAELKTRFKKNPADFETGMRLALYQKHDNISGNDYIEPIILKVEREKKEWKTDELVTATRLLLQNGNGSLASRYLYTLYLRQDFQKNSDQRAKILYQLFKVFSGAEYQKLPLTKGDLRFYEDVAKADTNPGISTGILSLIFSDTNPRQKLETQENQANTYFNRAAAYRIFEEYKKESPISNELAQMHLELVQLYTSAKEPEVAEKVLNEFAGKFENSKDYPAAAMKLAEAFSAADKEEKARETYQKILNYFGKRGKSLSPQDAENDIASNKSNEDDSSESADEAVSSADKEDSENEDDSSDSSDNYVKPKVVFDDYLSQKNSRITYQEVLAKYVASLAKDKKTAEILALYSNEITKYPAEEWLYEQRLSWLEQTNLTEEKLRFYKTSLARFKTNNWRDKLARFFVREKQNTEFTELSEDLVGKLNDAEIQEYLEKFIDGNDSAKDFKRELYLRLYQSAHQRFPHNIKFVSGLLTYYKTNKMDAEWRKLSAEYYFESKEIREGFLDNLAKEGELRKYLQTAQNKESIIYELFRADASARLSNFENSVEAYRKLNQIYPHTPEFAERLIAFTRSFGQKNRAILNEAAEISKAQADYILSSAEYRTRSGEIFAELGNYEKSREEWEKLIATAKGSREVYLDTATIYWDYFLYDDALRTIGKLRQKFQNETLYAFESAAILESQGKETQAIAEYVKAFDANRDDQKEKSQNRLVKLFNREAKTVKENKLSNNKIADAINTAYSAELANKKDSSFLTLGYAEFLKEIKLNEKAENVLNQTIAKSTNKEFLRAAQNFYQSNDNKTGEQAVLKRLAELSTTPRQIIGFRLQLAESFEENKNREAAKLVLDSLVQQYPTNYGVLTESVNFYKRLGFENQAVAVLKTVLPQSKGRYRKDLTQRFAKLLIQTNQLAIAEQMLTQLHDEDKTDTNILYELANISVRTGNIDLLRRSTAETIGALKQNKSQQSEDKIAELRFAMINAFTRLKDYRSAIEQYIEIINREPDNGQLIDNSIRYVQRYGGADILLNYYLKLSNEAFKNYRWNVILAKIYEANNDLNNAVKNYQAAIVNQPEMVELYLASANIEAKRKNYDAALKNYDTILELTNDAPFYVNKKIEILQKAGRLNEIAAERAKLPAKTEKKIKNNEFSEAKNLINTEKEKAREIYRQAFTKLLENPLREDLKTSDISGYVQTIREEEPLNLVNERLWNLREKLVKIADTPESTDAGEARRRISVLDNAMVDSIGNTAKSVGTDEEISALHEDLKTRIDKYFSSTDQYKTISLAQNISVRAGFSDLEETILQRKVETNLRSSDKNLYLQNLINFYNDRGAYQKTFDILEKYSSDDLSLKSETARLIGNREKEVEILRAIYLKPFEKIAVSNNESVERLLELLYTENRDELKSLIGRPSAYQLQLINFLLAKGEAGLAHQAIENSEFSKAWKVSRHAEVSLALKEFNTTSECYFCEALQFDSIGKMAKQIPDKQRFLINDDWFFLMREYGEWLYEKNDKTLPPSKFLVALTENLPNIPEEQVKLGVFYLQKGEYEKAIQHFQLVNKSYSDYEKVRIYLGTTHYLLNRKAEAEKIWSESFQNLDTDDEIRRGILFLQILKEQKLATQAREKLSPIVIKFLETNYAENSDEFQSLIRDISASFTNEAEKAVYFRQILKNISTDKWLAKFLIDKDLIAKNQQNAFYELIINKGEKLNDYDYNLQSVQRRVFNNAEAEFVYVQENDYETKEPDNERLTWQKKYLELLLEQRKTAEAKRLIAEIEAELKDRYARPMWLHTAKLTVQISEGKFDLAEAEKVIGITVPESATDTIPPSLERFNEILRILKEEKQTAEALKLSESFFARNIALEEFETANFVGLARVYFEKSEMEKALQILRLMIDASVDSTQALATAELLSLDAVKAKLPNAAKITKSKKTNLYSQTDALKAAAELAAEFKQSDAAIDFRQAFLNVSPFDVSNKIELAKLLAANNRKNEAAPLLNEIIGNKDSLRSMRWEARMSLREMGENVAFPQILFDPFSQFYYGLINAKANQPETAKGFFINSLIADKDAPINARQELIKSYVLTDKPFAALRLAKNNREKNSDEMLQLLSEAAEKIKDYYQAAEFERTKSNGGDKERIAYLKKLLEEQNKRATDFTVDTENTRKL